MKRNSIALLCFLSTLGGLFTSASNDPDSVVSISDPNHGSLAPFNDPAGRSLLSQNAEPPAIIVASMDGTISSVDHNSQVVWSLSSGPSLYSVYQALPDSLGLGGGTEPYLNSNNFVDIDDHLNFDIEDLKEKFRMAGKEEDSNTQGRSKDRFITNFSKKSTVFIVDAKSGKLINKYKLDGTPSNLAVHSDVNKSSLSKQYIENLGEATAMDLKKVNLLCITRTNYEVLRFERISGKVLSNMSFAEIKADFVDQGIEHSLSGDPSNLNDEIVSGYKGDLRMLPPQKEVIVVINPDSDPFLSSYQIGRLPERTHKDDFLLQLWAAQQNETTLPVALAPLPMLSGDSNLHHSGWWKNTSILVFLPIFLLLVSVVTWFVSLLKSPELKHTMQVTDSRGRNSARRKKARKLGNDKNSSNTEKNDKNLSSEEAGEGANRSPHIGINGKESWSILTKPVGDGMEGRMVGKLFVSNVEIAKGSNGTVVLEGNYDGRPVAVKRLVQTHHDVAFREIQNLIASDRHPNVVRWYGVEYDSDFVYLSLERCTCSLHDLIRICSESSQNSVLSEDKSMESVNDYNIRLDSVKGIDKNVALWKANGYPSPLLLKIMRDVVSGLAHLHELGIIHRDLKPQNVLIIKERSLCAKLSDMGISKRLQGDMSSLGHHATGYGSSGWQAPEQLLHGRQTRAVDLFSLGCVLFFCITGGRHPFGDRLERDINIVKNRVDLFMVEHIPEAVDLLSHLLDPNPELRIKASNVLDHPLFWSSEMRLSFLRDASDRVELEDRENGSDLLKALENVAPVALGVNWDEKLEVAFINNIGRYRRYKFDSTRDLLRVIRNKLNHYRELPKEIQEILGPVPEGFDAYFASRFPKLLIEVFKVVYKYCEDEECFRKYFKSNSI